MRASRGVMAVLLVLLAQGGVAAPVYRWVDAEGNVQFGNAPPNLSATEVMRSRPDAEGNSRGIDTHHPLCEQLTSDWRGTLNDRPFRVLLMTKNRYQLSEISLGNDGKPGNSMTNLSSGEWQCSNTGFTLRVTKQGAAYGRHPKYQVGHVVSLRGDSLTLVFDNGDRFVAKRDYSAGFKPSYMRGKY